MNTARYTRFSGHRDSKPSARHSSESPAHPPQPRIRFRNARDTGQQFSLRRRASRHGHLGASASKGCGCVSPAEFILGRTDDPHSSPPTTLGQIQRVTAPESIATALRGAILDGTLVPGSRLIEGRLSTELGVTRPSLREAFALLADEGLIVRIPFRGAFVADVETTALEEIATLRYVVEPFAIERSLPSLHGPGRTQVLSALAEMAVGAADRDLLKTIDAHMSFHRTFYQLAEHQRLLELWLSFEAQLQLSLSRDHRVMADLHEVVNAHSQLFEVIDAGNMENIRAAIATHVRGPSMSAPPRPPRKR